MLPSLVKPRSNMYLEVRGRDQNLEIVFTDTAMLPQLALLPLYEVQ